MSVTILEALQNADMNISQRAVFGARQEAIIAVAAGQLHNGVELLLKGYDLRTEVEPLLEKHGSVDEVPEAPEA